MTHTMKLHSRPFEMIRSGRKTIELRLFDEKRRLIRPGDTILFMYFDQSVTVAVKELHVFPDFAALYANLPLEQCGYLPEELPSAEPADMNAYYSAEEQAQWGVVGIEIQLIEEK